MRIAYSSLAAFKGKASLLASLLKIKNRKALETLARISGYKDYHEVSHVDLTVGGAVQLSDVVEQTHITLPSLPMQECQRIAEALALDGGPSAATLHADAPVIKHRGWRHLLRAFVEAHPEMRPVSSELLERSIAPAASMAFWLTRAEQAPLMERGSLTILVPGASYNECHDDGRWLSFVPWLVGRPHMNIRVILVGIELVLGQNGKAIAAPTASPERLSRELRTALAKYVSTRPTCEIHNGTVGQWLRQHGDTKLDACVMFAPGFSMHFKSWLTEDELLPLLRRTLPIAAFAYSRLDALEDIHLLRSMGVDIKQQELIANPWHSGDEMRQHMGAWSQYLWNLDVNDRDFKVEPDSPAAKEFLELMEYAQEDFFRFGADMALERLGARWPVRNVKQSSDDAIFVLPDEYGVLESTREVGFFDENGFSPLSPSLIVSAQDVASRPDDSRFMERILWALRLQRNVIAPQLEERERSIPHRDGPFGALSPEDIQDQMREFLQQVTGEDVDPDEFMEMMRASGGVHGPTHFGWYSMLESLEWELQDWKDDPERFEAAFYTHCPKHDRTLPVVCEAYAFFPDDAGDELAHDAMKAVERKYRKGALLLFKGMPYMAVDGHKYGFAGMLWWNSQWRPFALNVNCKSADDVIDQVESGFAFGQSDPRYADEGTSCSATISALAYGVDPNDNPEMVGLRTGKWVTLMPA